MKHNKETTVTRPTKADSRQLSQRLKRQLHSNVKERLEHLLWQRGYKRKQLAGALGMTAPRLSSLMQDHVDLFSLDTLIDIAHRCDVIVRLNVTRKYTTKRHRTR
jgi:predicted XRE-type DNA-binding protein